MILTSDREATKDELAAEVDRRGSVIEALEKRVDEQECEIKAIMKSVLYHFGPTETGKVVKDALAAREG